MSYFINYMAIIVSGPNQAVGALTLAARCKELEALCRCRTLEGAGGLLDQAASEPDRVRQALRLELHKRAG